MLLRTVPPKFEVTGQQPPEFVDRVAPDFEAAAFPGALRAECRQHEVPAGLQRPPHDIKVSIPVSGVCQEVEGRPIVPQCEMPLRFEKQYI
jgi:hypothetical protein